MKISRLFKTDLTSKMEFYRNKYKNTNYIVDLKIIKLGIYFGRVEAHCFSDCPHADIDHYLNIYRSKKFQSYYEARGHAEMEIAEAMSLFKSTRFIFTSPLSADIYEKIEYRNGRKLDLDDSQNHTHEKLCHCGARFDGIECPKCGNWDF